MQPARYCRPSRRSASDSMNGAAATNFSASAIASISGCEYTPSKLEPVLTRVNISTGAVHIWNSEVVCSGVRVLRPGVTADRQGHPHTGLSCGASRRAVRAFRAGPPTGAEQADLPGHRHLADRGRLPG